MVKVNPWTKVIANDDQRFSGDEMVMSATAEDINVASSGNGYIRVKTYMARRAYPVPDVLIEVYQVVNGEDMLLNSNYTDESGIAEIVVVATPPLSNSFSPYAADPFRGYRVVATHPSFISKIIPGVRVFPNVVTLLEIELIPRPAGTR